MAKERVLLVDDEAGIRFPVREFLEAHGYQVLEAESCTEAEHLFRTAHPDAAVLDYLLPDGNAIQLMERLRCQVEIPIVILTAHGSIDLAVQAIKLGAEHFLTKPVHLEALVAVLQRATENRRFRRRERAAASQRLRKELDPFVGSSPAIQRLANHARRIADADCAVLIQGETGVGKGVLARWLHTHSPRAEEPFLDLNCAALCPELVESELFGHARGAFTGAVANKPGLFEVAHRGTVLLDEIGDVDLHVQAKLLKVVEEKRFRRLGELEERYADVRLIVATHWDLRQLAADGRFREDLYFRISAMPLFVPPLRQRTEDIPILARTLLRCLAADLGRGEISLAPETDQALRAYPWPGNIRELRNVLERAVLLSDGPMIRPADLRFEAPSHGDVQPGSPHLTLRELERRHVERVLREEGGHVSAAARRLGVPRSTLYDKLKRWGIPLSGS